MPTQDECLRYARTLAQEYLALLQQARQAAPAQRLMFLREAAITRMDFRNMIQICRTLCTDPQCMIDELAAFGVYIHGINTNQVNLNYDPTNG
jgi:hypothetical protein